MLLFMTPTTVVSFQHDQFLTLLKASVFIAKALINIRSGPSVWLASLSLEGSDGKANLSSHNKLGYCVVISSIRWNCNLISLLIAFLHFCTQSSARQMYCIYIVFRGHCISDFSYMMQRGESQTISSHPWFCHYSHELNAALMNGVRKKSLLQWDFPGQTQETRTHRARTVEPSFSKVKTWWNSTKPTMHDDGHVVDAYGQFTIAGEGIQLFRQLLVQKELIYQTGTVPKNRNIGLYREGFPSFE